MTLSRFFVRSFVAAAAVSLLASAACVEQDDDKPNDEDMKVAKQNILATAPTPKYPVNADLDGKVVYLGLDVDPATVEPGKDVKLTHYWKLVAAPGDGWKTFTHLEGPNHQSFINADHAPVKGKYPVSAWKVGDIVRDEHTVRLPAGWASDTLNVYVGLWRGNDRMPITSGPKDTSSPPRVIAASIPVKLPPRAIARKRYVVRKLDKAPKIDGKLDDAAWKDVPSTGPFVNTMTGAPVDQKTEAKLGWDNKFLYVAFQNDDSDVWSSLTKRDDKLWTQEADELMIDADGDGKTYVELQFAPNGNVFDTYLPTYRKYEDSIDPKKKPYSWNSKLTAKVAVDGTLNKREDKDKGWTVEIAIPLEDVKGLDKDSKVKTPPAVGDVWRINMFRMDVPQGKPQQASGWSPPLVGDFHALDKFGEIVFADEKGSTGAAFPPPLAGKGIPSTLGAKKVAAAVQGAAPAAKAKK
ncbi:MAG TPA: carbohydrate-binding family 9-like protein [Polyangia bacterium]|nr:carbohydrate-binding family 9-like protein [Polyangia bacterium]